jgi:hypothetical protein
MLYPLQKRWYLIVICILLSGIAATRYLYMATSQYQATATLRIEDAQDGMSGNNLYRDFDVFKSNPKVQTEVEVLRSRSLFEKALDRLDFYVEYYRQGELKQEEVYHTAPFLVDYSITDSGFYSMNYNLKFLDGNNFMISYERFGNTVEKQGVFGTQICDRGVCITVNKDEPEKRLHLK